MKFNLFQKLKPSSMIVLFMLMTLFSKNSEARLTVTFEQIGSNVVASSNGSLILGNSCCFGSWVQPDGQGVTGIYPLPNNVIKLGSATEPVRIIELNGRGDMTFAGTDGSFIESTYSYGDPFGFYVSGFRYDMSMFQHITLPINYVNGTPINFTTIWENKTLSDLHLTANTSSSWLWGGEPDWDLSIRVLNPTPVPAPLPILGAVAALGWSRKLRQRIKKSAN